MTTVSSFGIAGGVSGKGVVLAFPNPTKNDRTKIPAMEKNTPFVVIILMPPGLINMLLFTEIMGLSPIWLMCV
jgi:hypothetical protein